MKFEVNGEVLINDDSQHFECHRAQNALKAAGYPGGMCSTVGRMAADWCDWMGRNQCVATINLGNCHVLIGRRKGRV